MADVTRQKLHYPDTINHQKRTALAMGADFTEEQRMKKRILGISVLLLLLALTGSIAAAQTSQALWFVKYWNNREMSGDPAHSSSSGVINYNWGNGSPHASIDPDSWSGQWTSNIEFPAGTYRFTTISDDGVRLYVGDKHIITDWNKHTARTNVATVSLSGGSYPVALDYFDDKGAAQLRLYWEYLGPPAANGGYVTIINSGTVGSPPAGNWSASYWNNRDLQGSPAVSRSEAAIDYDWGSGSPAPGIGADNWSARWTSNVNFTAGTYRFVATMDDGMRVWVDNSLLIDSWYDSTVHTIRADRFMSGGSHNIRVEYYEHGGGAIAQFYWHQLSTPAPAPPLVINRWLGEYYNNVSLSGAPALTRDDADINFNWGNGSPAPGIVSSDNFSVRWTRSLDLTPGRYRFTISHDDGARLWAGGVLVMDRWFDQAAAVRQAEIDWAGGVMPVRLEYYDHTGLAQASLSWTRLGPAADTGGPLTATVNTGHLNFRTGPGVTYSIITSYPRGTMVTLMGRNSAGNWVYVTAPSGQAGWMHAGYLATTYPISALPVVSNT
jgi:hypothetical protein